MEKFFTPNKFFWFFCVLFVLEFLGLQIVGYLHITNQAKLDGERIFNWRWPSKNMRSVAEIYDTKILSRNSNDAVVKVLAREHLDPTATENTGGYKSPPLRNAHRYNSSANAASNGRINLAPTGHGASACTTKCAALLNYYRMNNKWFLGKVEFE